MLCLKKGNFPLAHLLKAFWTNHKAILKPNTTENCYAKVMVILFLNSAERSSIKLKKKENPQRKQYE